MDSPRLALKITCGPADHPSLERLAQGLTVAATAAASGAEVSLWLTGEAVQVALRDTELPDLEHSAPLGDLVAAVLEAGSVTVCTQCAARRGITDDDLVLGARIAGAASWVEEVLTPGTQALVY